MSTVGQSDFGGGIYRSPRAPAGSVYDCVDGLIDDELVIFRRGGVAYRSGSNAGATILGVADAFLPPGPRTVFWTGAALVALAPDDSTLDSIGLGAAHVPQPFAKAFGANGALVLASSVDGKALVWAGSKKATYTTGTVSWAANSRTITGVGTAWLANVDEGGMFVSASGGTWVGGTVEKVNSNTQLVLRDNVPIAGAAGTPYTVFSVMEIDPAPIGTVPAGTSHIATVGSPGRLVVTAGARAYFSAPGQMGSFDPTDYHELPPPATIIGADSVRDMLVLFSTQGVWLVSNMNLDLTDADGNPQQQLSQITKDVILWANSGVAGFSQYAGVQGWAGQFVVPALDDVYMLGVESPAIALSRGIRPLYRQYVRAGYRPGLATVYQGHYFLPIVNGTTVVDLLVCRLDQRDSRGQLRPAWTRWGGFARGIAFTGRARPTGAPSLVAAQGQRLIDATSCFAPDAAHKADADGSVHSLDVIENDVEPGNRSTFQRVELRYELTDAATDNPTITGSYATGEEGTAWTALTGAAAAENDGREPKKWKLPVRARNIRFRWQTVGPAAKARIRARVLYVRDSNRP